MYYVTRKGSRIAGSIAVPLEAARKAAHLLNREQRGRDRDEFGVEPAPDVLPIGRGCTAAMAARLTSLATAAA